jgi:histone H3/H4
MTEYDMSIAPMHRIIKKAGAERVSEEASLALRDALEDIGVRIAREALDFTKHAGRKTVKADDIQIAVTKVVKS